MHADDVSRTAYRDLQFRILRKPAVCLGLCAWPEGTGRTIDGARESQVLGGTLACEHMGALLQACDSTRILDEIGEVIGVGPQTASEAVSLLWTGGIVEEGDIEPAPGDPPPELARLFSRLSDSTGINDPWQDAARCLAAARVVVVGDVELAGGMVAVLKPTLSEIRLDGAPRRGDTLTVLVETVDLAARSQEVACRCRQEGIALLRMRAEQEAVTAGPYVDESFSPCLACVYADELEIGPRPEAARHDIIVDLAARAAAAPLARAAVTHLPGDARRTDLVASTYSDRPVVSCLGYPVCSVTGAGEGPVPVVPSAPVGVCYKQFVAIPPAAFVDSKGHQQYYKPSNLRFQRELRDWPVCPRTPLLPADLERLDQPWPIAHPLTDDGAEPDVFARPTLSELVTTLALPVGVCEPLGAEPTDPEPAGAPQVPLSAKLRRWTAAGDNIGSVTAYVLVSEHVRSGQKVTVAIEQRLVLGTYACIERDHALALIGPIPSVADIGTDAGTDAAAEVGLDLPPDGVGARIVLTGNVDKVARKYSSFALHIAVQDCGCFFEVLRLVAEALGAPLRVRARWDEQRIARALGTDPAREPVCIVVDPGGRRAH